MTVDRVMSMTNGHRVVLVSDITDATQIKKRIVA